jgi:hypothetical protein
VTEIDGTTSSGTGGSASVPRPAPDRDDVIAMVASFGDRPAAEVGERIDSIQLAWLVHQVEQRYGMQLELDDAQYGRMGTISGAVEVLREAVLVVEDA